MVDNILPIPVVAVVAEELANNFSHTQLDTMFEEHGAPGEPPCGNKVHKCREWLKAVNKSPHPVPTDFLGRILEELMEVDTHYIGTTDDPQQKSRHRISKVLARHGLRYERGGMILGVTTAAVTRTLRDLVGDRDLGAVEVEFERALANVESQPRQAVTDACSTLESLFKIIIEDDSLELPNKQSIKPLWSVVQDHLGMDAGAIADNDLKRIVSGLTSIVDGIGSLRTHVGAHGQGRQSYRIEPRHARLAVHAASTLAVFVLERWFLMDNDDA